VGAQAASIIVVELRWGVSPMKLRKRRSSMTTGEPFRERLTFGLEDGSHLAGQLVGLGDDGRPISRALQAGSFTSY